MCEGISNRSGNLFFISKIIKMYNLVISITLANKTKKFPKLLAFSGKANNNKYFLESFSETVLIILDFF